MDTVVIKIHGPYNKFKVMNKSWFLPELNKRQFSDLSPTEQKSTRRYLRSFRYDPPHQNGYLPKIEVFEALNESRNEVVYTLQATFSVPKLLHGNSVEEVFESSDLEKVIYAFRKALSDAGIQIESNSIANARVSQAHFCKNVILPHDIRMQEILAELKLTDISKAVDVTLTESKQGGQVLHIYSQTVDRVFYDKVHDALRTKGKRKDKGRIEREREIIDRYGLAGLEIFRYEFRLKKNQTLKRDVNAALGRPYQTPILFKDLFEPSLCKKIVLKSWNDLIQRPENQLALLGPTNNHTLFLHILDRAYKQGGSPHSLNRALNSFGLIRAIRELGAKEVRRAIFKNWNTDHSERVTKKIKIAVELAGDLPYSNSIAFIAAALERFECITRLSLENVV